jgi:oligoendopeptidase F
MEELKKLTTEELKKVYAEINKELFNRKNDERKNAYEKLINAMKEFYNSEFFGPDSYCYFEAFCEDCESDIDINFFEYLDLIITELERGI